MGDGVDIDLRKGVQEEGPDTRSALRKVVDWCVDVVRSWGPALVIVLVIRSVLVEPFQIPSGSMVPTLAIGDFILVSKFAYGLRVPFRDEEIIPRGEPVRGDVVVFTHPPTVNDDPWCYAKRIPGMLPFGGARIARNTLGPALVELEPCDTDYIKRIVGLPGDTVEVRDDVVYLNGIEQPRTPQASYNYRDQFCQDSDMRMFEEVLDGESHPVLQSTEFSVRVADFGPKTVPDGHYFMMGDNRDNSADSRFWGFVPRNYIKGKALFVWMSLDFCDKATQSPFSIRQGRIGTVLR